MRSVKAVKKHSKGKKTAAGAKRANLQRLKRQTAKRAPLDGQILIDAWNFKKHGCESLTNMAASSNTGDVEMELPDDSAHGARSAVSKKGIGKKKRGADFTTDDVQRMLRASTLDAVPWQPADAINRGRRKGRGQAKRERDTFRKLVQLHGCNYEAMTADPLNWRRWTAAQLKEKIGKLEGEGKAAAGPEAMDTSDAAAAN